MHIQFPIQLATIRTIQRVQGLLIDNLASNLHGIFRHGLIYTTLFKICTKENL
jgi:hypothetical protein